MKLNKLTVYNSPFLGVYSYCSEDFCIVSSNILQKEYDILNKTLNTKIIKMSINQSPLIGVYLTGIGNKLLIEENSINDKELEVLEKEKIKIKLIKSENNAFGNIFAINKNYGLVSYMLEDKAIKEASSFLKIDIEKCNFPNIDLPGTSIYVNDYFFLANPNIKEEHFNIIKKKFKVEGKAITLNYGDIFVGNDIISNSKAILVGSSTSNIELMKVDDIILNLE